MSLTHSQIAALEKIEEFLVSGSHVFVLKGYAGTGKTFLINEITKLSEKHKRPVKLAAPTGRSARIINRKTGCDAVTIHSMIYNFIEVRLKIDDPEDENAKEVEANREEAVWHFAVKQNLDNENQIYIIDEASLVGNKNSNAEHLRFGSGKLLDDLFAYWNDMSLKSGKNNNRKIIFIGDDAQLPPVTDNISAALSCEYIKNRYDVFCEEFTLKEIVRHKKEGKPLLAATEIRNAIEKKIFNEFSLSKHAKVYSSLEEALGEFDVGKNIIITYSNYVALKYNLLLREKLLSAGKDEIKKGEILIVSGNNYKYGLLNGEFVIIENVAPSPVVKRKKLRGRPHEVELVFREATIKYYDIENKIAKQNVLLLESVLWSDERALSADEIIALRLIAEEEANVKLPRKPKRKLKKENPQEYKKQLGNYKSEKEKYEKAMRESLYFNALLVKFGYAITCHKAQGGEWEKIIITFEGFNAYSHENFFRWAYTAVTRAKESIIAVNPPEFNPWSNLSKIISAEKSYEEEVDGFTKRPGEEIEVKVPNEITGTISKNIYKFVFPLAKEKGFGIASIESLPYMERYTFNFHGDILIVNFNYNKKGELKVRLQSQDISDPMLNLFEELKKKKCVSLYEDVNRSAKMSFSENFPEKFLEDFYTKLSNGLLKAGIEIRDISHKNFAEKYLFVSNGNYCEVIFHYTKKKVFSGKRITVVKFCDEMFMNYCLEAINKSLG